MFWSMLAVWHYRLSIRWMRRAQRAEATRYCSNWLRWHRKVDELILMVEGAAPPSATSVLMEEAQEDQKTRTAENSVVEGRVLH